MLEPLGGSTSSPTTVPMALSSITSNVKSYLCSLHQASTSTNASVEKVRKSFLNMMVEFVEV